MDDHSPLEVLLRASNLVHGRIQLSVTDGRWMAAVSHTKGHMAWQNGQGHADPVNALRAALIEDERLCRDQARKYEATEKIGDASEPRQIDLEEAIAAAADDIEDLIG